MAVPCAAEDRSLKKENLVFLFVGFAFGVLMGAVVLNAFQRQPDVTTFAQAPAGGDAPSGPMAPTQVGDAGGGAAPMMAEISALRKRIQDRPDDVAALVRLGNIHQDISDFDNSIAYYEKALQVGPENPDVITDLGICYRGKGEYERALELFRQSIAVNPEHWQSLFNVVIVSGFDLGDYPTAFGVLEHLEEAQPQLPQLGDLRAALEKARDGS
jgi:cytochrome c-type biogenesis protein CcmH/NrfG